MDSTSAIDGLRGSSAVPPVLDRRAFVGAALMLSVSALAAFRAPTKKLAAGLPPLHLGDAVPKQFGSWQYDGSVVPLLASPDVEAQVQRIYNQTLARTYRDLTGNRIMLMIAYGEDQADATTQVHQPELCYAAQGFEVLRRGRTVVELPRNRLPVVRLFAHTSERPEPITYWTTVADRALNTETERRLARARFALQGQIPDGMLVRVSSIDANEALAFRRHDDFVTALAGAVPGDLRPRIFGRNA